MLRLRVWVLRECYISTKNHVQWMSQIKTISNKNKNKNKNNNLTESKILFCS